MFSKGKKLVVTALMLAVGMLLPNLFHMFAAGTVMLPMHIPVFLCGLICGPLYGGMCGFILPWLSAVFTGMPPLFPTAIAMCFELCIYGVVSGYLYQRRGLHILPSMLVAMLAGRAVSGVANLLLLGFAGRPYTLMAFLTASFVTGVPGIITQLVSVPLIVEALIKAKVLPRPTRKEAAV